MIRSADKGARMSPESESSPVDRSELAIRAFPWLVAAIPIICIGRVLIEKHWGDTKLVTYLKTGRMDGAAENFALDPEFNGNRGNISKDYDESSIGVNPQIGQEWMGSWGSCGTYNNPDVLAGMSDPNRDGVRDTYDPGKPTFKTAWDMQRLVFGQSDGPYYEVVGGEIRAIYADLTDPAFRQHVNGVEICVTD